MPPETTTEENQIELLGEEGTRFLASSTLRNGIRIDLHQPDADPNWWRCIQLTPEQAEHIGQSLVRWARDRLGNPTSREASMIAPFNPSRLQEEEDDRIDQRNAAERRLMDGV